MTALSREREVLSSQSRVSLSAVSAKEIRRRAAGGRTEPVRWADGAVSDHRAGGTAGRPSGLKRCIPPTLPGTSPV